MTNNQIAKKEDCSDLSMLKKIAENNQSLDDIKMLTSSKVTDQLKVFLVAQARRELSRVVVLLEFLDKLEDRFISKVNEEMDDDNLTLKQYNEVINTITSLLARSNEVVSRVLKDESLTTILNTTIYSSNDSKVSSVVSTLKDSQSRERVRVVINQAIALIQKDMSSKDEEELVEVGEESDD